ncbi:hypothetical protein ATO6_06180 [Oceanicola sp. 22II-s10i]|uniref:hypothetical protein n=1 Tax=Oceanicola sp. 22II-s10i TaxID=1317116 RepID=UPI000B52893A|nr:hypothetical protein [Oceanicola sp. 22II-s10i]OWU86400.1 hypothetical protein ATO6_06180 [Oceanicola sp. 22II-s10i]
MTGRSQGTAAVMPHASVTAQTPPPAVMSRPLAAFGLVIGLTAPFSIVYWNLRVRAEWIAMFPDQAAVQPPTISRAISVPEIGAPFAFWITIFSVVMLFNACVIGLLYARTVAATPAADARDRRRLTIRAVLLAAIQLPVSAGMVILSVFNLGPHTDLHMFGSYLMFISASLAQFANIAAATAVLALMRHDMAMRDRGLIDPRAARFRIWFSGAAIATAIFYLALFIAKDTSLRSDALYFTYVTTEEVLIALLMSIQVLHAIDFWHILSGRRGRYPEASGTPSGTAEAR